MLETEVNDVHNPPHPSVMVYREQKRIYRHKKKEWVKNLKYFSLCINVKKLGIKRILPGQ